MASRLLNRRELREQNDQAEQLETQATDTDLVPPPAKKRSRAKTPAGPRVKKPRAKKAPPRMRARWGIFDGTMKQVAVFDYSQRAAADVRLADLLTKKKGSHFLQIVKDEMPVPEVVAAPALA